MKYHQRHIHGWVIVGIVISAAMCLAAVIATRQVTLVGALAFPAHADVSTLRHSVQAAEPGRVRALHAQEGALVEQGAIVVQLDDTQHQEELALVEQELFVTQTRIARLQAQSGTTPLFAPPQARTEWQHHVVAEETARFTTHQRQRAREDGHLMEQAETATKELAALHEQLRTVEQQITLLETDLLARSQLADRALAPRAALSQYRAQLTQAQAQRHALSAQIAISEQRRAQVIFDLEHAETTQRTADIDHAAQLSARAFDLQQRIAHLQHQIAQMTITAPVSGRIFQMQIAGPGAVVQPSQTLLDIVPTTPPSHFFANVSPRDIDALYVGQPALISFPSIPITRARRFTAHITTLSADLHEDPYSGAAHYVIELTLSEPEELPAHLTLRPGLPAQVTVQTTPQSIASYLIAPLRNAIQSAFSTG